MTNGASIRWGGLETAGMAEAKCSLLLQDDVCYEPLVKALPSQKVTVHQDPSFAEHSFVVDFPGATILQLEPHGPQKTMPVTLTVAGRCLLTPENYQDFSVLMRTKEQAQAMELAANGSFDWPDVRALLLCPCCGQPQAIPSSQPKEYWMVFYPLLQIAIAHGSQLTLGTRTVARLVCLDCLDDLVEGLQVRVQPGKKSKLSFTLPVADVLAEAGSASFLEDGPPRPDSHPHVDDLLDAWTLYNLWEHSGAWEALQNDGRQALSRSLQTEASPAPHEARLKDRLGKPCGNRTCRKIHGRPDAHGQMVRLTIKCKDCLSEYYCSPTCRIQAQPSHQPDCLRHQRDRAERRERKAKKVACDTCHQKFPVQKMKKCSRCRTATYCSTECQKMDWEAHKRQCQIR